MRHLVAVALLVFSLYTNGEFAKEVSNVKETTSRDSIIYDSTSTATSREPNASVPDLKKETVPTEGSTESTSYPLTISSHSGSIAITRRPRQPRIRKHPIMTKGKRVKSILQQLLAQSKEKVTGHSGSIAITRRPRQPRIGKHQKVMNGKRVKVMLEQLEALEKEKRKIPEHLPVMIRIAGEKICGGTLLDNRHILTAAHCFFHARTICTRSFDITRWKHVVENPKEMVIEFGGNCVGCTSAKEGDVPTTSYSSIVEKVMIPKRYVVSQCRRSDIAVLRLNRPIDHKLASGMDIRIPYEAKISSNASLEVSGFGYDPDEIDQETRYLNKIEVKLKPCPQNLTESICMVEKESNVCMGDSGSGLMEAFASAKNGYKVVHGVVSRGTACKMMKTLLQRKKYGGNVDDFKGQYFTSTWYYTQFICKATESRVKIDGNVTCKDLKNIQKILEF